MKTAIATALASGNEATVTTIKLTGTAAEITGWNWRYLIELYNSDSSWGSLTALDLSGMTGLRAIRQDTGSSMDRATKLTTLTLPDSLSEIGVWAFRGCTGITLTELPVDVTEIGNYAFANCKGITITELPVGVTRIGESAFYGCTGITLTELPGDVTQIGDYAFYGCTGLDSIIMEPMKAPKLGSNVFNRIDPPPTIYVPKNGKDYDSGGWESLNTVKYSPTKSISLPPTLELRSDGSGTLAVEFTPTNSVPIVLWESSDTGVVKVDDMGKVTAIAEGTATITATSRQGGKTASCVVTVRPIGTDATLKSLSLSNGELTPVFSASVTNYSATVDYSVSSVTITAVANDSKAKVEGGGAQSLNVGSNTYTVTVTAENGTTKETYTITITREAASTDATLKSLSLSSGTLTPVFSASVPDYSATVDYSVSSVTITATANSDKASVSGTGTKPLNEGANRFAVTVTAEDGTKQEYTITVTRNSPTPSGSGGSGSGGGSSGGSGSHDSYPILAAPEAPKPNNPVLTVIGLPVTVGNGTATGQPDDGRTASAIAEAQKDAKARTNGIAVQYDAKTAAACDGFSITIRRATLDRLIAAQVKYVALNTGIVDLTFDLAALKEIAAKSTGDITLTAARETGLTGDALAAVGARPAYRLAVNYTGKDGKAATVQSFGAGRVTVGLAYKPAAAEQTGSLFLVYSADGKGAQWLSQSSYDRTGGNVVASTGHFSVYAVGCKTAPAFTDTANHWAKADIDFAASRGLLAGTGDATFGPETAVTQGQFSAALDQLTGRASDKPANPDGAITREQMALTVKQYAAKWGYALPVAREAETFADDSKITNNTYRKAIQSTQQAGIMSGKGNRFGPGDTATRAEAAAVLRRFAKIVIDRSTAGGWTQNDAGRWLYYLDAKPVTGWKQIENKWYYFDAAGLMQAGGWKQTGNHWYYFHPDGTMAVNTTIDGYEIGPDGKRKE